MKIEVGKIYCTRDGHKAFVNIYVSGSLFPFVGTVNNSYCTWKENGQWKLMDSEESKLDLVSLWEESIKTDTFVEELVAKANEGCAAIRALRDVPGAEAKNFNSNKWEKLKEFNGNREFRYVKLEKKFPDFKLSIGNTSEIVTVKGGRVKIGCQTLILDNVLELLGEYINNRSREAITTAGKVFPCKEGLFVEVHGMIQWAEVERLYRALKEMA